MPQIVLESLAVGDVAHVQHESLHGGVVAEVGHGDFGRSACTVGSREFDLDRAAPRRGRHQGMTHALDRRLVFGGKQLEEVATSEVLRPGIEESFGRRADVGEDPGLVENGDHVGAVLDQPAEPLLAALQPELRRPFGIDISGGQHDARDLAVRAEVAGGDVEPPVLALGGAESALDRNRDLVGLRRRGDEFAKRRGFVGVREVDRVRVQQFGGVQSEHPSHVGRSELGEPILADDQHEVGGLFDERGEALFGASSEAGFREPHRGQRLGDLR